MKVRAKSFVHDRLFDESNHPNLTPGHSYTVFEVTHDSFRVLNDNNEPVLYNKLLFDVIDQNVPTGWSMRILVDGEYYLGPVELNHRGFYEEFFDKNSEAVAAFDDVKRRAAFW